MSTPSDNPSTTGSVRAFIDDFSSWARSRPDIQAVTLVGSHARHAATKASDIDLVILADTPKRYLDDTSWISRFGIIDRQQVEHYGPVTSLRVWYRHGPEVEYGLTTPKWARSPLDPGTRQVIEEGMLVLFEQGSLLSRHTHQEEDKPTNTDLR